MAEVHEIELSFPARAEYVSLGRLAITGIARFRPIAPEDVADLKLILTEACSNSVRHAYDERSGHVEVSFELYDDRIAIEVRDAGTGPGISQDEDKVTSAPTGISDEGGLGLALIKMLSDEFTIGGSSVGGGTTARFVKYLTTDV